MTTERLYITMDIIRPSSIKDEITMCEVFTIVGDSSSRVYNFRDTIL